MRQPDVGRGPPPTRPPGRPGPVRYLLLSGAKVNAGDFLIRRRSVDLLAALKPDAQIRVHDRWCPLEEDVGEWADAVLLCGGPALQPHLYPGIYPLTPSLSRLRIPIIGLGLGWKGMPGDGWSERTYHFTARSQQLLRRMEDDGWAISCRDPATERVLHGWGFERTIMTGDPAWFDLDHIGSAFDASDPLDALLLSLPASPIFFDQSVKLLRALRERGEFRRILAAFNHGWTEGEHVEAQRAAEFRSLRDAVTELGAEPLDLSGGLEGMLDVVSGCDIHVGYRLHSHLLFLSQRKPTVLIEEDGRGSAAGEALRLPGIAAWRRPSIVPSLLSALELAGELTRPIQRRVQRFVHADDETVSKVLFILDRHRSECFSAFADVADRIDQTYRDKMQPFLRSLP